MMALLTRLSSNHDVSLHCSLRHGAEADALDELAALCRRTVAVTRGEKWSLRAAATWLAGRKSYLAARNESGGGVAASLRREFGAERFDCVHVEHYYMMGPALDGLAHSTPILLGEQGIEHVVAARHAEGTGTVARLLWNKEVRQTKRSEEWAWRQAERVVTVSENDRETLLSQTSDVPVGVVPNAVAPGEFPFVPRGASHDPVVAFVGTFRFFGNVAAARWLISEVMPLVRRVVPRAEALIIGEEPPDDLAGSAGWVRVEGWAPSLPSALRGAAVMAAPLWTGSGTKLKILEAMAMGLPVVTTRLGLEGLSLNAGSDVLVADDVRSFADATVRLLTSPERRLSMGERARCLVEQRFSWDAAAEALVQNYREAINRFAAR
jgi:glycosyltransferase involved in cell wall biosynthesis